MIVQHDVIDLDQAADAGGRSDALFGRFGGRRVAAFLAVFVAGLVVGGVAVNGWRDHLEDTAQAAKVALVVRPETANFGGSATATSVNLSGRLVVFNAGPRPVVIRAAEAEQPGVRVASWGQAALPVPPDGTGRFLVQLQFGCPVDFPSDPLPIRLSVETVDGQVREVVYDVALADTDWQRDAIGMCDPALTGR
ncbi:hypothetical protein ACFQY4_15850 [Catellatospora bangladeshensis]|nr:hypothetical protein [Catellatospora bangladeshensis]